jgi:hypothetical protein
VVSFDLASARRRWHYHSGDIVPDARIRADTESLVERLQDRDQEIDRFRRRLSWMPVRVHELGYEDLVAYESLAA